MRCGCDRIHGFTDQNTIGTGWPRGKTKHNAVVLDEKSYAMITQSDTSHTQIRKAMTPSSEWGAHPCATHLPAPTQPALQGTSPHPLMTKGSSNEAPCMALLPPNRPCPLHLHGHTTPHTPQGINSQLQRTQYWLAALH